MKIRVMESKASKFAEALVADIISAFKYKYVVDDVQWDESNYPEKAKMSFVVYNVSAKTVGKIRDEVEQYLQDQGYDIWIGHSVDFEKDSSYVGGSIKSAYRVYFSVKKAAFLESASERFLDYDSAVNYVENQGISLDVAGNDFANMIIDDFEELANEDEEFSTIKLDRFIQWAKQESLKYEDDDDSYTEAKSTASQISKMTYKGARIPNYSWAQFDCGAYVLVTAPQNKALDLKVSSKAGRIVGKVKDTYVYSSNNSTGRMGRDNDFRNELDASAPQSCLVEVHDDYKIKQHGEATNRIIIPTEWLREISEKDYKDAVNRIPRKGLDKMFNKNKKRLESFSDGTGTFLSQLENEIKTAVKKFMMQPHIGFPEDEVEEYSNVKIKLEGEHIEIQVGAELSYEPLEELCTALNTVIAKYDHNAYFEPECPGRIVAYLMQYPYLENKSSDLTEALDLGNDGSSDDSYTHYTFTFNGQRYSFQECHDNYKVAYHRNKDFINGIYPYDDADHPWAYSDHNDTKWKIVKAGKTVDTIDSDDLQPVLQLLQKYDKDVEPRIIHN